MRTCTARNGKTWSERCDRLDENGVLEFTYLNDRPGFPFPFKAMRGGWAIEAEGDGSRVDIWWTAQPETPAIGPALIALFGSAIAKDMAVTVARMGGDSGQEAKRSSAPKVRLSYC